MLSLSLYILIGMLLFGSTMISSSHKLIEQPWVGIKSITPAGWVAGILNIFIIFLTALQVEYNEYRAERHEAIRDSVQRKQYNSDLLSMKNKFDSSARVTDSVLSVNLGIYGYKLDSTNGLIRVIRDSARVRVIQQADPVFYFASVNEYKKEGGYDYYYAQFNTQGAGSSGFNIDLDVSAGTWENGLGLTGRLMQKYLKTYKIRSSNDPIGPSMYSKTVIAVDASSFYNVLLFYVHGTYTNLDKSKSYEIDQVYHYQTETKELRTYPSSGASEMKEYFNRVRQTDF